MTNLQKLNEADNQGLDELTLRDALKLYEDHKSINKGINNWELANKFGLSERRNSDKFYSFMGEYDELTKKKDKEIKVVEKQYSNHSANYFRVLRNTSIGTVLGMIVGGDFNTPELFALGAGGFGLTLIDEELLKGSVRIDKIALSTLIGGAAGYFIGDAEAWKYIGAGLGAVVTTTLQMQRAQKNLKPADRSKSLSETIECIEAKYTKDVNTLISIYSDSINDLEL